MTKAMAVVLCYEYWRHTIIHVYTLYIILELNTYTLSEYLYCTCKTLCLCVSVSVYLSSFCSIWLKVKHYSNGTRSAAYTHITRNTLPLSITQGFICLKTFWEETAEIGSPRGRGGSRRGNRCSPSVGSQSIILFHLFISNISWKFGGTHPAGLYVEKKKKKPCNSTK